MSVRVVLEKLGIIQPRDEEVLAARAIALKENEEAHAEISASQARREVLRMRHEQILRRQRAHRHG